MPDYSGLEGIGFLLGGGAKQIKAEAYEEGRLHTAKTEDALAAARIKQIEAKAKAEQERQIEQIGDMIAKSGHPDAALHAAIMMGGRGNSQQMQNARLGFQEQDFRTTLGDPDAELVDQFAAGQGVQGKVLPKIESVGTGSAINLLDETPELAATPVGKSTIRSNEALAQLRDERRINPQRFLSTGRSTGPHGKPPSGFIDNPNYDQTQPVSDANPVWIRGTQQSSGVRERQVVARVLNAAANNAADLANIVEMPSGADAGVLGSGMFANQGIGILDAVISDMKMKLSDDEIDNYNAMLGGLTSSMVTLERMGMQGTEGLAEEFGALVFRPGDTLERKMLKLALIRQSTENAVETVISVNPMDAEAKTFARNLLSKVQEAVPYTPRDVILLQRKQKGQPTATLRGVIAETHGIESNQPTGAAPAATGAPMEQIILERGLGVPDEQGNIVDDRDWILTRDAQGNYAWVSPDGADFEEVAQ